MRNFFIVITVIAVLLGCGITLHHFRWVRAYRNAEKYLEKKYGIKFEGIFSFQNYGISHTNDIFLIGARMMYHIEMVPEGKSELKFTCIPDNDKTAYHDDYLPTKFTYPLLLQTRDTLSRYTKDFLLEIVIPDDLTQAPKGFPEYSKLFIAVKKGDRNIERLKKALDTLTKEHFFGAHSSVYLFIAETDEYLSVENACRRQLKYLSFYISAPFKKAGEEVIFPEDDEI